MRTAKFMLTACGLSTLFLGIVIANAVLSPMPVSEAHPGGWTTTVSKTTF
jgi:hypothetical protein